MVGRVRTFEEVEASFDWWAACFMDAIWAALAEIDVERYGPCALCQGMGV